MAGARMQHNGSVMAEINVTPFTDVLLVLLIIFMILAALAVPPGFQKRLGNTSPTQASNPVLHQIDVEVTASNHLYIDGTPVRLANLYAAMAQAVAFHATHGRQGYSNHIALLGDRNANYNTIIKVLDAARAAGDEDVGFMTE